jgi:hypothetical protein
MDLKLVMKGNKKLIEITYKILLSEINLIKHNI